MRYEDYTVMQNGLPIILNSRIKRTSTVCAREANWHENPEIQLCTKGKGWVLINGEKYSFEQGDIVFVNDDEVHYTATDSELEYSCLILDPSFFQLIGLDFKKKKIYTHIRDEEVARLFLYIEELCIKSFETKAAKLCVAVIEMVVRLFEKYGEVKSEEKNNLPCCNTVKNAICYIKEHIGEKLGLELLAKAIYCDKYALSRSFKKVTGQTVVEYINGVRCQIAANEIARGARVSETAYLCGFENMSYFTKTFKKYTGKLPSQYKNK